MRTLSLILSLALLIPVSGAAASWRPVTEAELAQKTPRIDPAADAEIVFWDVRIEDRYAGGDLSMSLTHYIRLKIFTDRGKEQYSTIELEQPGKRRISDVAGRTIKADGTILEMKKDAVFERELAKTKGYKMRGKAFTLPNVQTGDLIEYSYRETRDDEMVSHMRLYFQREIPIWNVTYHVKPLKLDWLPFGMRGMAFQFNQAAGIKEPDGFFATTAKDMPAFKPEPNMPPEDELQSWMLIYYEEDKRIDPEKYWKELGRSDFARFKPLMSANGDVKRLAAELVSGAASAEDKLARLDEYCRVQIRNLSVRGSSMTAAERKAIKENMSPGDTLKQKTGFGIDVNLLFASLANAAGFEARMARISDRGDTYFNPAKTTTYFLPNHSVGVKVEGNWRFFDPGTPYLERGMLRWQEEDQQALVSDPKDGFFVRTAYSEPNRSTRKRRAALKLLEDGSLEGTVEYIYTGHAGASLKAQYDDMTPAAREEDWKDSLRERLSTAEISDFQMNDAADQVKPVIVRHKVSVPAYATRTGKRILLQPAFFQRNLAPRFTAAARKWPISFNYGWAEDDEITIELPAGWEPERLALPASQDLGGAGSYAAKVEKSADGAKLVYSRQFSWGRNTKVLFPASSYPQLKTIFNFVQQQDSVTVALTKAGTDAR